MDPEVSKSPKAFPIANPLSNFSTQKEPISEFAEGEKVCETCRTTGCEISEHPQKPLCEFVSAYRFCVNSMIDFDLAEKHLKTLNENKDEKKRVSEKLISLKTKTENLLAKKIEEFNKRISQKIADLEAKVDSNFMNLEWNFLEAESCIKSNNIEVLNNVAVDDIIGFFNKETKSPKDLESMINLVKKNSDQEKIKKNLSDMETILYSKVLSSGQNCDFADLKQDEFNKELTNNCEEFARQVEFELESPAIFKLNKSKYYSNPQNLKFKKDITDKLQKSYTIDSVFCAFSTFDGRSYVAWGCPTFTVEVFDLLQDKLVKSLSGFNQHIYITRHFFDKATKKDYLLSTSYSKSCKIWDCQDFSNILTIQNCHTGSYLYSGLLIFDPQNSDSPLALTVAPNENIKVWDFKGALVNQINTTTDYTYYINVWYDDKNNNEKNNIFLINANSKDVKIYDFRTGLVYKTFYNTEQQSAWHMCALVEYISQKPYLFESDGQGNLRVWEIETQSVFKKVSVEGINLRGICLWNELYVLVAGTDKTVKVINYMQEKLEGVLDANNNILCTLDKIHHPLHGECLFTGGIDGKIKMFTQGDLMPRAVGADEIITEK